MPRRTFDEFKKFIALGKVIDLAVGIVIGAAFTAIMQSLVKAIVNPFLGLLQVTWIFQLFRSASGQIYETLVQARDAGPLVISWGSFITAIMIFMIITWLVFFLIQAVKKI